MPSPRRNSEGSLVPKVSLKSLKLSPWCYKLLWMSFCEQSTIKLSIILHSGYVFYRALAYSASILNPTVLAILPLKLTYTCWLTTLCPSLRLRGGGGKGREQAMLCGHVNHFSPEVNLEVYYTFAWRKQGGWLEVEILKQVGQVCGPEIPIAKRFIPCRHADNG